MNYTLRFLILTTFASLIFSSIIFAHEEPAKTLYEKSEQERVRKLLVASHVKACTIHNLALNGEQAGTPISKAMVQEYDKSGRLISVSTFKNDSVTSRTQYNIDATGNIAGDINFSETGKITEKNRYSYDRNGRVISGVCFDKRDSILSRFEYDHSQDHRDIIFIKYLPDNRPDYRIQYFYQSDFDSTDYTSADKIDSSARKVLRTEHTYNNEKRLIKKTVFSEGGTVTFSFIYTYDQAGNLVEIIRKSPITKSDWKLVYTYNAHGLQTEAKRFDAKGNLTSHQKYVYSFYE